MQEINVKELMPHPRNTEFFDDMSGQKWEEFLESVKFRVKNGKSGIIERIIITTEMVIISGHQRVRACKELGIEKIKCEIRKYDNEDEIIQDLIETNIRQRGDISTSSLKMGRIIRELERLYGVRDGSAGKREVLDRPMVSPNSQEKIADMLGMTTKDVQRYKKLTTLIPEFQDLIDDKISASTASRIIAKLSPTEQEELIKNLDITKKYTQKQIQEYIDKLKEKEDENSKLKLQLDSIDTLKSTIKQNEDEQIKLKNRISELVQQSTKTEFIEKEVDKPETLEQIKKLELDLKKKTEYSNTLYEELMKKNELVNKAMGESTNYQLVSCCSEITLKMLSFVKEMSKYDYMAESFNEIPNATRIEYLKCIKSVKKWADRILDTVTREENTIDM